MMVLYHSHVLIFREVLILNLELKKLRDSQRHFFPPNGMLSERNNYDSNGSGKAPCLSASTLFFF